MKIKNAIILSLLSLLLFFIAAIYITYPLVFHIGSLVTGFGDELVIAWIQNWVIHALLTNPLSLFEANIYFPYHNTLAFSETFIVTSILAMPVRFLSGQPISTVNFTLISSILLLGFSIYLLCFYLTKDFLASLFTGMMVIFSPAVLDYSVHLQLLSVECVPLSILFFLHFIKTKRTLFLGIALIFFLLQFYNSLLPSFFIFFSLVTFCLFLIRPYRKKVREYVTKTNILLLLITGAFMLPIAIPYLSVSQEFHYVRDIRDTIHFALQPEDFLYPGNRTQLNTFLMNTFPTNRYSENSEFKPGYLGVIFSLLALFTIIYCIRYFKKNTVYVNSFFIVALIGLILSLGPALHLARHTVHIPFIVPLPYFIFYYLLPGFNGVRESGSWNMLFIIAIAVTIALVLHTLLFKRSRTITYLVYLFLFIGIIIELSPLKLYPIMQKDNFPKVYSWLATTNPNTNIIELPIYNWNMQPFTEHEMFREYFGTVDFRRTANGYTGFSPPPWQTFLITMDSTFPSKKAVTELKTLGITDVIIHTDEYDTLSKSHLFPKHVIQTGATIVANAERNPTLELTKRFSNTYVFKIK